MGVSKSKVLIMALHITIPIANNSPFVMRTNKWISIMIQVTIKK